MWFRADVVVKNARFREMLLRKERKGKEEYLYSAFYILCISQSAQAWITQFCLQIHHACLSFVSVHQMAPPLTEDPVAADYSSRRDDRLRWRGWLTYGGQFAHISGHPSATGRAQDRESSPAKDRRSTTVPRNQPRAVLLVHKYPWLLQIETTIGI